MDVLYQILLSLLPIIFFVTVGIFIYRFIRKQSRRETSNVFLKKSVSPKFIYDEELIKIA